MNSLANWQTELSSAFRSSEELAKFLGFAVPTLEKYPVLITRSLAELIKAQGPQGVLARQFLPHEHELKAGGFADPIGDEAHAKTSQLVHRYHNRALLIPTTVCPVNCRYCFRKNELQSDGPFGPDRESTLNYLAHHQEIEEVIFTGGDPLLLSDEKLAAWFEALATIEHVKYVRFHSRVPVILPSRLTPALSELLTKWSARFQFVMVVHTNHVSEWSKSAQEIVKSFRPQNLSWLSQSVLLKGINDDAANLCELFRFLNALQIRAYYLHHPDQVKGGMHFWLTLEEGRKIWGGLRDKLPGWMLPEYIIDIPGGHGKVPAFNPEGHRFSGMLLDPAGQLVAVPRPQFQVSERQSLA